MHFRVKPTCFFELFLYSVLIIARENRTIQHAYTTYIRAISLYAHTFRWQQTPPRRPHHCTYPAQYRRWYMYQTHWKWKLPLHVREQPGHLTTESTCTYMFGFSACATDIDPNSLLSTTWGCFRNAIHCMCYLLYALYTRLVPIQRNTAGKGPKLAVWWFLRCRL